VLEFSIAGHPGPGSQYFQAFLRVAARAKIDRGTANAQVVKNCLLGAPVVLLCIASFIADIPLVLWLYEHGLAVP
jgi:hypothetical protein